MCTSTRGTALRCCTNWIMPDIRMPSGWISWILLAGKWTMQPRCALRPTQRRGCHRRLSDVARSACPTSVCRLASRCSQRRFHSDVSSRRWCPFDRNARRPARAWAFATPRVRARWAAVQAAFSRSAEVTAGTPTSRRASPINPAARMAPGRWRLDGRSRHRGSALAFAASRPHRRRLVENRRQCAFRAARANLLTAASMPTRRFHREATQVHPGCHRHPVEDGRTPIR